MSALRVPLFKSIKIRGKGEAPPVVRYADLGEVLTAPRATDARMAQYSLERVPHRLVSGKLADYGGVPMPLIIVDDDDPTAHETGEASSDAWWANEKRKIETLTPKPFACRTRGGCRLLWRLVRPFTILNERDAATWSATYLHLCDRVERNHDIHADRACADWTRLHRVPHGTRDGVLQDLEVIGDPHDVPAIELEIVEPAPARPKREPIGEVEESELGRALHARGWLSRKMADGGRARVCRCAFFEEHTPHDPFDGSTVVYAPTTERRRGYIHCKHRCARRPQRDFREALGIVDDEPARLVALRRDLEEDDPHAEIGLDGVKGVIEEALRDAGPGRLVVVQLTPGAGKSEEMIRHIESSGRRAVVAVPDHKLGGEMVERLLARGVASDRRRGVLRVLGANGKPVCIHADRAAQLQAVGGSVPRLLCPTCSERKTCPARRRGDAERVIVTPHALVHVAMDQDEEVAG